MPSPSEALTPEEADFYRRAMRRLQEHDVPFLVGGAYAFARYTGIVRHTKDFDVFLRRRDLERAFAALEEPECRTEVTAPHWLAKAYCGEYFVDLIFASGNGVSEVDEGWFERAREGEALGVPVLLCAPEDILWPKAYIQERERYDGADVAHLILSADLDWEVLLRHFDAHWRVLLGHLVLFGFTYPSERHRIPAWVMEELIGRLQGEVQGPTNGDRVCMGTLLSRAQYLRDVEEGGFRDGRLYPGSRMGEEDVKGWTEAIDTPEG
jgi:hypothetical protein